MIRGAICIVSLLLALPLSADPIDLTNICPKERTADCAVWMIKAGFDAEVFGKDPGELADFKKIEKFPIWIDKTLPDNSKSFETYTFVGYFYMPGDVFNASRQPGISFGEIGEAFEIYVNGNLIAKEGTVSEDRITYHRTVRDVVYEIDRSFIHDGQNQIVIKLMGDPRFDHTGFYSARGYTIGLYNELKYHSQDRIGLVLICLYLFVGAYHFLLFVKRRKDRYNLYYSFFAAGVFTYLMTRMGMIFELPLDTRLIQTVELTVLYLLPPSIFILFDSLFLERVSRISLATLVYGGILSALTLLLPMHLAEHLLRLWQLSVPLLLGYGLFQVIRALLNKNQDSGRILVGLIVIILCVVHDILDSAILNNGIAVTKYGFSLFVMGIALILANRFMRVHNAVEDLNENLEKKVEDRTRQLQESLDTVQDLKIQQDGDYFLTSLLINPLSGNHARSSVFTVHTLASQKKKFKFKKWDAEIGGDLVTTHSIRLNGRAYVAFLNGDAMGKSMQGAGGALVLGTVFKSVITRTQSSSGAQDRSPERWLKEVFLELQNTFVSFDGSMLISAVLGLADEETGLIYFVNAEHPWIALYRKGTARFIESELSLRKIGVFGLEGSLSVKTFQMEPQDVLFVGSDGRDDLWIGSDKELRNINEDETLFLKNIQHASGDLTGLYEHIRSSGEIIDDLTLLRIGFQEDANQNKPRPPEQFDTLLKEARIAEDAGDFKKGSDLLRAAEKLAPGNPTATAELARSLLKNKDYNEAAVTWEKYSSINPADTEGMYLTSYSFKLAGEYRKAADFGESVRLREPNLTRNLLNLADAYRLMGDSGRCKKLLDELLILEPTNENALKLRALFD